MVQAQHPQHAPAQRQVGRLLRWGLPALLGLLALPGFAQPFPQAKLDSLRQLARWPEATQQRLLSNPVRATPASGAVVARLLRQPLAFSGAMQQELLLHLIDRYFYQNRPSLVVLRGLECRQLAIALHDSARRSRTATVLSYAYSLLEQPRAGIAYAEEARRFAQGPGKAGLLGRAANMLSIVASQLHDYPRVLRANLVSLRLAQRAHDRYNEAIELQNLAQNCLDMHRDAEARRYLDSAAAKNHVLAPSEREGLPLLQATLAQHEGRLAEAVRQLLPVQRLAREQQHVYFEVDVLNMLIPTLAQLNRYREAYNFEQRRSELRNQLRQETTLRHAQELQAIYNTEQHTRELSRQRQRIEMLQAQAQATTARRQRRDFWLMGALAVLALAGAFTGYRRRLARIRRETARRARIAADLHEEVGTLLTRVSMQAELLRDTQPGTVRPAFDRLVANTRTAARTVRDVVWGIDPHADTVGALADRLREYLHQATGATVLLTELSTDDCLPDEAPLRAEVRQQLYLIGKEAIAEAVRHAPHATQLHIGLFRAGRQLGLRVLASGPPDAAATLDTASVRAMQQRAAAVGGTADTRLQPGGFVVEARVPF